MNKIVREHYPVAKLPEDLRVGLPEVTIVVSATGRPTDGNSSQPTLAETFSMPLSNRSKAEIDAELEAERGSW